MTRLLFLRRSSPENIDLQAGESILRTDPVLIARMAYSASGLGLGQTSASLGDSRLARLVVTSKRLVFLPVKSNAWVFNALQLVPVLGLLLSMLNHGRGFLGTKQEFEFKDIQLFRSWQPPFTWPPMLQLRDGAWTFQLLTKDGQAANKKAMKEHYEVIENAWNKARVGTA